MRILDIPMSVKSHGNVFEDLISREEIQFNVAEIYGQFGKWVDLVVGLYLGSGGVPLPWEIGDVGIRDPRSEEPSVCIKVNSNVIKYLDIYPCTEQFMFIKDIGHHESLHPDEYFAQVAVDAGRVRSSEVMIRDDGSSVIDFLTHDDKHIIITDNRPRSLS